MSGTAQWDTKRVKEFKAAFLGRTKELSRLDSEQSQLIEAMAKPKADWQPSDQQRLEETVIQAAQLRGDLDQSLDLLRSRAKQANDSFEALKSKLKAEDWARTLGGLEETRNDLAKELDKLGKAKPSATKDASGHRKRQMELADKWTAFEARCVSVANHSVTFGTEAALGEECTRRATEMAGFAGKAAKATPTLSKIALFGKAAPDFSDLQVQAKKLSSSKASPLELLPLLDELQHTVQAAAIELAPKLKPEAADDLLKSACSMLYQLDVSTTAKPPARVPYTQLLKALKEVPTDHIVKAALHGVEFKAVDHFNGTYNANSKKIEIRSTIKLDQDEESYTNPETGKTEPVNSFGITTLHEVGHSVDEAYKVMASHMTRAGAGGWSAVSAMSYLDPFWNGFLADYLKRPELLKLAQPPDKEQLKSLAESCLAGSMDPADVTMMLGQLAASEEGRSLCEWIVAQFKQVELPTYRFGQRPWNRDISGETIFGQPASQQSGQGEMMWWAYSGADRATTSVSKYQWRAPAEWFAELYAFSWYAKVEPPATVLPAIRQYMYGGHIT